MSEGTTGRVTTSSGVRRLTVLQVAESTLVDDLAVALESAIEDVHTASTVERVLSKLETAPIDCIISDLKFDDGRAVDLLNALSEREESLPFVVWTAEGSETIASEMIAAGVTDYVPREADPDDCEGIGERIRQAVETHTQRRPPRDVQDEPTLDTLTEHVDVTEQKEHERKLDLFRTLVDHASDGFFIVDPETSALLDVNDTACQLLDYEREDLLSLSVTDINPEFSTEAWADFAETVRKQGTRTIETTHQRRDESTFPVEVQVAYVSLDRDYHVATVRDITEHRASQRELERQRELLRHTEEIAQTGGWEANLETGDQRWTPGTRAIHGVTSDFEPTVEAGIDFFHPDDRDDIEQAFNRCAQRGEPYDVELRLLTTNDDLRWVRARGVPIREGGEVIGVRGAIQDVTERKEREQNLKAARKRYQTLVEAAPDPIFVADAETGEIVETNSVAAALRKQPREEIIGLHQTELHPTDETERYREAFETQIGTQTTIKQFEDGSQMSLVTTDGERIPVSISVGTVSLGDQTLVHGIFRDISDQKRYEDALKEVNTTAQSLLNAETDTEIAHTVVDVATDVLDPDSAVVYLYDEDTGELVPVAPSDELEAAVGEIPRIQPGDDVVWSVFIEQELTRFDDSRTTESAFSAGTPLRSQLLVPLGEYGVFVASDTEVGACDGFCVEIAELLCATAESALARAERTQQLRERERKSKLQARRLERLRQLNDEIRAIMNAIVEPHSHASITQSVCNSLATLDQFDCVWIGEPDTETDELESIAQAGVPELYVESLPRTLDADNTLPAVRAIRTHEAVVESSLAGSPQDEAWRQTALLYEFRSVISVPLVHDDILYGVLTIASSEPGRFGGLTQTVLTELGSLIGYALNTLDQRNALLEDETVTLTFDITGATDVFVQLASRLEAEIRFKSISTRSVGGYLVHFLVEGVDTDTVTELLEETPAIQSSRLISDTEAPLFEVATIGECVATTVANMGANIHKVTVSETNCQINLSIPRDRKKQRFVTRLEEHYPDVNLKAHRTTPAPTPSWNQQLDKQLTDRQQEILTAAYYSGFFDQPRKRTGKEIAGSLGISQPAFSKQLRTAEKKLLEAIYE